VTAGPVQYQTAIYKVNARPEDVFSFYTNTLTSDGWEGFPSQIPNSIEFFWNYDEPGHETYGMLIEATQVDPMASTTVTVSLDMMPSY